VITIAFSPTIEKYRVAKRKRKSKASPTPTTGTSEDQKSVSKSARKTAAKPARKTARKSVRKSTTRKRISSADRRALLAEAKSKGWTADQIAKKAGVSMDGVWMEEAQRGEGRRHNREARTSRSPGASSTGLARRDPPAGDRGDGQGLARLSPR
jgi:hypothetical protein